MVLPSRQLAALLRAIYWGPARAAFRAIGPSYLLLLVVAGFVFGGQGLHPRTLVDWMLSTGWGLALGYGGWWLFSGRGYRAFAAEATIPWLRTMPLSRMKWCCALLPWVLAIEAPWLALWVLGATDWRVVCAFGVTAMGARGHLRVVSRAPKRRRPLPRVAWVELALNLARVLRRRYALAFLVLTMGWVFAGALCLVMGKRESEALALRQEFVATTLGLASLVSGASASWLLHGEMRRLKWLLGASPGGRARITLAECTVVVGQTLGASIITSGALAWHVPTLTWGLVLAVGPNASTALLAAMLVPLLARGRAPSRAPALVVMLCAPYLFGVSLTTSPLVHTLVLTSSAAVALLFRTYLYEGATSIESRV